MTGQPLSYNKDYYKHLVNRMSPRDVMGNRAVKNVGQANTEWNYNRKESDNVRFKVFTAVTTRMPSFGMLRCVALVRTDISEEHSTTIIRMRIGELGTMLAVTSNRRMP
jgi:hypothetical protein